MEVAIERLSKTDIKDPLLFWPKQQDLASLFPVVKMYLSIPASSADNERGFSSAGFLLSDLRTRLLMDHFIQEFRLRQFILSGPNSSQHSKEGRENKMQRVKLLVEKYSKWVLESKETDKS
ncbi:MAG TPA: hAT transposon family protein [Candidatus Limnocylindrales bacterium]|nr:hAT transposon family protein [Candidatus Limnocylindrales bacterium]